MEGFGAGKDGQKGLKAQNAAHQDLKITRGISQNNTMQMIGNTGNGQ